MADAPELPPLRLGALDLPLWVLVRKAEFATSGLIGSLVVLPSAFGIVVPLFRDQNKAERYTASRADWRPAKTSNRAVALGAMRAAQSFGATYVAIDPVAPGDKQPDEAVFAPIAGVVATLNG